MRIAPAMLVLAPLALSACHDAQVSGAPSSGAAVLPQPGAITGRICDPSGLGWLADAVVYANILDGGGHVVETRSDTTDADGTFLLPKLPAETAYDLHVQFGSTFLTDQQAAGVWVGDGQTVELPVPVCFGSQSARVAIVTGPYDDFARVLQDIGITDPTLVDGSDAAVEVAFLSDPTAMSSYDMIFFDSGMVEAGVLYPQDGGAGADTGADTGGGAHSATLDPSPAVLEGVQAYVAQGGRIFVSDQAYDLVARAFPGRLDFAGDDSVPDAAQVGLAGTIHASITDGALASRLGQDQLDLAYDLPLWAPVEAVDSATTIHLEGDASYGTSTVPYAPLLVSFTSGEGKVVYSSFVVAANDTPEVRLMLEYLIDEL